MDSSRKKTDYAPAFDPELCSVRESRALLWSQRNCGSLTRDASTTCLPDGAITRYYGSAILVMHCEWVLTYPHVSLHVCTASVHAQHAQRQTTEHSESTKAICWGWNNYVLRMQEAQLSQRGRAWFVSLTILLSHPRSLKVTDIVVDRYMIRFNIGPSL